MIPPAPHANILAHLPDVASRTPSLLVVETMVTGMTLLVCLRVFSFLRALRGSIALDQGMIWLSGMMGLYTLARMIRYGAVWMGRPDTGLLSRLPNWVSFLALLWLPVYLIATFQVIVVKGSTVPRFFRLVRRTEIFCAALLSLSSLEAWTAGTSKVAAPYFLFGMVMSDAIVFWFFCSQRRRHGRFAAQAMGLLIIAALLPVVIFWITLLTLSGQVVPVTPYKLIVDLLASLLITGCLVIFSNSRFADLLLGDVLRIYWSGYAALFAWLGSDFLIREARSRPLVVSAFYEVLGFLFVLFCMAAVFRGVDVAERTIARWFFDKPDYDQLLLSMCGAMLQSESEAEWSQHLARCLCEQAGFAAARLIKLAESKVDFSMLARPGQVELFPLPDNFLRFVTDPAADVLLPVRVQGEVVYILAVAASPVRGELLQIELTFLRRFVRHLEEQLELRRSASLRRERERHEEQLRAQLTESELRALRAQIQPHFLFNSLNTIAHLCIAEPSQAERMTTMLANIFRYVLTSTNDGFITLGEEIQFIENYLAIEQMRFGDRLKIELAVEPETRSFHVPPLILQPLIENAVRHGLAPQISGGLIRLSSWRSGATLEITVEDTGVGLGKAGVGHGSTRVGLANIRKRLECHYGSAASLQLSERQGGGVCAAISIGGSL